MQIVLIIVGAFVGIWLADLGREMLGLVIGGALGYLVAQNRRLKQRLNEQSAALSRLDPAWLKPAAKEQSPPRPAQNSEPASDIEQARALAVDQPREAATSGPALGDSPPEPAAPAGPVEPGLMQKGLKAARNWLTSGNVPVKLGVVVSFFGVSFLLKYAVDRQVLTVPLELRYAAVAAAAMVMLGVGWGLRERLRVYGLSLLGGGIGILFLTIFGAFRLHPLLPAPLAFVLLIALTAAAGVLAVVLNARGLAILGMVGGFLAPVLISTGSGNHVALFSYYLLLNAAVLGVAWYRSWRILNLIGFFFTFGVAAAWGVRSYEPALLASTQPFLIAYFLFYQGIAVLYALRQPPKLKGLVDGTLVFGTPVIAFALQAEMVKHTEYGLAIAALLTAGVYVLVAVALARFQGRDMRLLIESFSALAVAFATIAIPLALGDRWTAATWSLEGAALIWIGVRQQGVLARISGSLLLIAGGMIFLEEGWIRNDALPVLNGNFLSGMLIATASLFSARYLAADPKPMRWQWLASVPLLVWGLAFWGGTGIAEIADNGSRGSRRHLIVAFMALSGWALARLAHRLNWTAARHATLAYLPLLAPAALLYLLDGRFYLVQIGLLAWPLAVAAHFAILRHYPGENTAHTSRLVWIWHALGLGFFTLVLVVDVVWRMDSADYSVVWAWGAGLAAALGVVGLVTALRRGLGIPVLNRIGADRPHWPFTRYAGSYLAASGLLTAALIAMIGLLGLETPGDPTPLPFVPLLNPLDLLTLAGLLLALKLLQHTRRDTSWLTDPQRWYLALSAWGLAAFVLTTIAVVRSTHHSFNLVWDGSTLSQAVQVQAALSVYWATLGFGGMIWGARKGFRWIWLGGTGLMALVVLKLFLVDLGNTGTVARIVSFLGVGVLLLVVGYLAPAPPRPSLQNADGPKE